MEKTSKDTTNKELRVTQTLQAPITLLWEVWTDASHIAKWWGPSGFTNTILKMDVIPGGEWRLNMQGPDGKNYPNRSLFVEIVPLEKIVFQHFNPNYLAIIVFEPSENETFMQWKMQFDTCELFETVVKVFKADEGLNQSVKKLSDYLKQIQ